MLTRLRLPPALKRFLAKDAFSNLRHLYWISRGMPEAEPALQQVAECIRPTDVVVEVGAASGGGTLLLSSAARHVFAFEPNKYSYRLLRHFAGRMPNVTIFNFAVGAGAGVARLNVVSGEAAAQGCSIRRVDGIAYSGQLDARMVSLDSIGFPIPPSILIVDCEGYEGEVLSGASELLKQVRMVFIETHMIDNGQSTMPTVLSKIQEVPMTTSVFRSEDELSWVSGSRPEQ